MAIKNTTKRFAPKFHIRTGDTVMVLSGDDKGNTGEVLQMLPERNRAVVSGINIVKKHVKATEQNAGGIQEMEATIHISNLALIDPKTGEATRIGRRVENGKKVRYSKKTGNSID
jgi:large subunit ribosomal protein L24